jgi:hypothetical protein
MLQRQCVARQRSASTGEGGQALAECRVEPLDVRRVDHPIAVRATPEPLNACGYAINDAAFDGNNASLDVALDDRRDAEVVPRTKSAQAAPPQAAGQPERFSRRKPRK